MSSLAAGLLLAASSPAAAQRVDSLPAGARVRANAQCPPGPATPVYSGPLLRPLSAIPLGAGDTLHLRASGVERAIAGDRVRSLQLRTGGRSRLEAGLLGAGIGAVAGAVLGATVTYTATSSGDEFRELAAFAVGVVGGGLGATLGGLIGATTGTGRWTAVMPPRCS